MCGYEIPQLYNVELVASDGAKSGYYRVDLSTANAIIVRQMLKEHPPKQINLIRLDA